MSTIQAVNNSTVQQAQGRHHGGHHSMQAAMGAAAQTLGMSAADLTSAIQGGATLTSLARQKGVSLDSLQDAMTKAAQQQAGQDAQSGAISQDQAAGMLQRVQTRIAGMIQGDGSAGGAPRADGTAGPRRAEASGGGHGGHPLMRAAMDAAASTLGMSRSDLVSSLQSGTDLKTLAQQKGVSLDSLKQAMTDAMQKQAAQDVQSGTVTANQADQVVQRIQAGINGMLGRAASGGSTGSLVNVSA
jgi:lambda repressor-like predicted transcriptional regulator